MPVVSRSGAALRLLRRLASSVLDRVRALATASETRLPTRTSIPTFREGGIDLVVEHWWGMLAPAGLPPAIAARLTRDLKAILDSHELATRLIRWASRRPMSHPRSSEP